MNPLRSVVVAFTLVGLSACNLGTPNAATQAPPSKIGTWQLVATSDGVVWKMNTETGETRRCLDGMVEKACVLANDVDSVAQLKPAPTPPAPVEPMAQDGGTTSEPETATGTATPAPTESAAAGTPAR